MRDDWRGARAGAAAKSGAHENHARARHCLADLFGGLNRRLITELGIAAGSETARCVATELNFARGHRTCECLHVGIDRDEIVPVDIPQKTGAPLAFDRDESIREDTTTTTLGALKPAFKAGGSVTAGNAPGVNDGAAAVVVMARETASALGLTPLARIVGQATSGLAPKLVLMTPVEAVRKVAQKVGWNLQDVDLFEINEAFSVQMVAILRELGIDAAKVNVHGGAVALGHPIGASGARVLTTLLYALKRHGKRRGIASLCLGGGNGVALAVELASA